MRENKGFSLVELILSIAILSLVLTTVTALLLTGTKQFTKGNADATMQREAQLVVNQIEDMIIDTNGGISYKDNTTSRELVLYNAISESGTITYTKEVIEWVAVDEEIRYHKWNVIKDNTTNTYADDTVIYSDQLLAEGIMDFKVDITDTKKEYDKDGNEIDIVQSVQIVVGCTGNDDLVTYATNPVTTLRNRMMLSDNPTVIFPNTPVVEENLSLYISEAGAAASVPVQYPGTVVERNKFYNFYVIVNDSYAVSNDQLNWSVLEGNAQSTIDSTGKLYVHDMEPNSTLTIQASYKDNPTRKVTGVVQVAGGREIVSVRIIRLPTDNVPFEPEYDSYVELDGFSEADKSKLVYKWTVSEPTWVNSPFTDQLQKLSLRVKQEKAYENKYLTITLTVSAPEFGCAPKSASTVFLVPRIGDTMDSYIERGREVILYGYDVKGHHSMAAAPDKETVYFCDEYGNHIPELDYMVDQVVVISSSWAGGLNLQITEGLPPDRAYYLKYIGHCINGTSKYDYERIFYIPAVELIGQDTSTAWKGFGSSHEGIDYKLYGYSSYGPSGGWNESKYTIEVQEIISNAPDGVNITAEIGNSYIENATNNLMRSSVKFTLSGNTAGVDTSAIKVHSIRIKIQMNDTEIFAYSSLTFTD